ncbi:MAG TPA: RNA polymerase sigma factor [Lachnospiraceae bacterium]|nr:RNA polymerase sigma factor [Lachnospiraceae bacterium]
MNDVRILQIPFLKLLVSAVKKLYHNLLTPFSSIDSCNINEKDRINDFDIKAQVNVQAERLLKEYGNSILRLAYSYLHNRSDAEDVLQETLIQYIKVSPQFESEIQKKAWLLRVASNISKNRIKYNKFRNSDELSEQLAAEEKEDLAFVWEAVKELPSKYREVIHLFYHEGYSTAQIARILNKNETTVRSLLHRGRSKLKFVLKEVYDLEE